MLRNLNQSSSGQRVCGTPKSGVLGSLIPSTGDNGAGYTYNDLSLPADNGKEICGRITTWPLAGTLTAYEDTSFEFVAPDGAYSFAYQLYVDGVATGSPVTVDLQVGPVTHTSSGNLIASVALMSGVSARVSGFVTHSSSGALAAQSASVHGVAINYGAVSLNPADIQAIADAVWSKVIEAGMPAEQMMRLALAALAGTSEKTGSTIIFKGLDGATDRIIGSFDAENNRTGAVLDGS